MSGWSCVPCRTCGGDQTRGWHLHDRMTAEPARDTTNDIAAVIAEHFVMWRDLDGPPTGEWFCECGETFGFSFSAINHVAKAIADRLAAHTSHQQDQLAAAWEEGARSGLASPLT